MYHPECTEQRNDEKKVGHQVMDNYMFENNKFILMNETNVLEFIMKNIIGFHECRAFI